MKKLRKKPLGRWTKSFTFEGDAPWDYASPFRAAGQFLKRHSDYIVIAVGIYVSDEDASVTVALTVEHESLRDA